VPAAVASIRRRRTSPAGNDRNIAGTGVVAVILEVIMTRPHGDTNTGRQDKDKGALEKLANLVEPPSRDVSDEEIFDPGSNIPSSDRVLNESEAPPSKRSPR
jgi:hypothetical protein